MQASVRARRRKRAEVRAKARPAQIIRRVVRPSERCRMEDLRSIWCRILTRDAKQVDPPISPACPNWRKLDRRAWHRAACDGGKSPYPSGQRM